MDAITFLEKLAHTPYQKMPIIIHNEQGMLREAFLNQNANQLKNFFSETEYFADDNHIVYL